MILKTISQEEGKYELVDRGHKIEFFPGDHPSREGKAVYWKNSVGAVFYHQPITNGDVSGSVRKVAEKFLHFRKTHPIYDKA